MPAKVSLKVKSWPEACPGMGNISFIQKLHHFGEILLLLISMIFYLEKKRMLHIHKMKP